VKSSAINKEYATDIKKVFYNHVMACKKRRKVIWIRVLIFIDVIFKYIHHATLIGKVLKQLLVRKGRYMA
jgi:hypothetical protein